MKTRDLRLSLSLLINIGLDITDRQDEFEFLRNIELAVFVALIVIIDTMIGLKIIVVAYYFELDFRFVFGIVLRSVPRVNPYFVLLARL